MQKKLLRSVLAAAFSAVVAFGALGAFSDTKGDVRADSAWLVQAAPGDSAWKAQDSAWAVGS
ncbi:hypothetical protein SAMN06272735_4563 [Streptomyces sp. TLI_55]|nr:hypothetical protein AQJ23_21110 [Streptomyces antibioticus]SNX62774.1 hypothetical protein SAMN06272735_4563 [Streptomyces sp. TLI_55]